MFLKASITINVMHDVFGLQTQAYALFFARHAWQTAQRFPLPCPTDESWSWWASWTPDERAEFFHGLSIHSRHRPDLIARDINMTCSGTCTVLDVCAAIQRFDQLVLRVRRLERRMYKSRSRRRRYMLARMPAARQVPDDVIIWEETHAEKLAKTTARTGSCTSNSSMLDEPDHVISIDKQIKHLAEFLYRTADSDTECLLQVLRRLVDVPHPVIDTDTSVDMMPNYRAWTQMYPVPPICTGRDVHAVIHYLRVHEYVHIDNPNESNMECVTVHWHPEKCLESKLPFHLADIVDIRAWSKFTHQGEMHVSMDAQEALMQQLYAFLVHVMYEIVTVAERSQVPTMVDDQLVWACIARLGLVSVNLSLNPDLLASMARIRAVSEPPVAWASMSDPSHNDVPREDCLSDQSLSEENSSEEEMLNSMNEDDDEVLSDESSSAVTDDSYIADSFIDDEPVVSELEGAIGTFGTLVPFEYAPALNEEIHCEPLRSPIQSETNGVDVEEEGEEEDEDIEEDETVLDGHIDVQDERDAQQYVTRLRHDWIEQVSTNVSDGESKRPSEA